MYIDIQNGANTATNTQYRVCLNAAKADVATKLATSNVGSTGIPVYFSNGIPVSCGNTLNVNITGNADSATKATQDGNGNVISSTYLPLSGGTMTGTIVTPGNDSVVIRPAKNNYDQIGSSSYKFWQIYATTFYGTLSGNATSANKLNTNAGSATKPVYFANGIPVATSYTLGASIPSCTTYNNGQVLCVVNGVPAWQTINNVVPSAEGVDF